MSKLSVLFLCTGNSCRSQMAEAIVNARLGEQWQAFSAGSRPAVSVHPLAVKVLAEIGIEHHGRPKSIGEFAGQAFDVVVTLCEDAEDECPVWLGKGKKLHQPFPDPAKVTGSDEEIMQAFRRARDDIAARIVPHLTDFG